MKSTTFTTRWLALFAACATLHAAGCATADDERAPAADAGAVTEAPDAAERADALSSPESIVTCGGSTCGAKERCCTDCSGNRFCAFLTCPQFVCPPDAQAPVEAEAVAVGSKCELSGGTCRKSACRTNEVQSDLSCGTERGCCLPKP